MLCQIHNEEKMRGLLKPPISVKGTMVIEKGAKKKKKNHYMIRYRCLSEQDSAFQITRWLELLKLRNAKFVDTYTIRPREIQNMAKKQTMSTKHDRIYHRRNIFLFSFLICLDKGNLYNLFFTNSAESLPPYGKENYEELLHAHTI